MSLSGLPTELLCGIWKHIHLKKDLSALVQVNFRFYHTFHKWLYCFDREYCNSSALFWAAARNEIRTAQASLEERANIPKHDDCLQVALQIAVKRTSCVVIELLINQGVDLDLHAALHIAVELGSCAVVELLIEKASVDLDAPIPYFGHLLQLASWLGDQKMMELLIEKGVDVNALGGYYGSALQAASWVGSWTCNDSMVKLLLEHDANVHAQGGYFGNALQAACWGRDLQLVTLLINHGANINLQGGHYGNALQAASWAGLWANDDKLVNLLLSRGANVNAQGGYYGSALQAASQRGYMSIVKSLLRAGADVGRQSGRYGDARRAASSGGHRRIEGLLLYWHWRQYLGLSHIEPLVDVSDSARRVVNIDVLRTLMVAFGGNKVSNILPCVAEKPVGRKRPTRAQGSGMMLHAAASDWLFPVPRVFRCTERHVRRLAVAIELDGMGIFSQVAQLLQQSGEPGGLRRCVRKANVFSLCRRGSNKTLLARFVADSATCEFE
jgi:ankyrin repeat protein